MTQIRRWCVVALGLVILIAVPVAVSRLPVHAVSISAPDLLAKVQAAQTVAYSGLVRSDGSLALPISDRFTDVSDLFGGRTTVRVWWRASDDWRVDKLTTTGEMDLFQDDRGITSWNYESGRVVRSPNSGVRLPRSSDLLPPALGHRLFADASPDEVTRLGTIRVAGVVGAGLRLVPSDARSSISHIDLWADPDTGLALQVSVFGKGSDEPVVTSAFLDLTIAMPSSRDTTFTPPPGADQGYEDVADIAAAANRYSPLVAPGTLVGMDRRDTGIGAVGLYGQGVTQIVAIPLWQPAADPLREQLEVTPGSAVDSRGTTLGVGPLNLLLTRRLVAGHCWLLVGTVTPQTLTDATVELAARAPLFRDQSVDGDRRP